MSGFAKKVCFLLVTGTVLLSLSARAENGEMLSIMERLQRLSHKLYLSMEAGNSGAMRFYAEELQGSIDALQALDSYGDYPVGQLATTLLLPSYKTLLRSVKRDDLAGARKPFTQFVDSCNNCHSLTEHGFIKIDFNNSNPYFQKF